MQLALLSLGMLCSLPGCDEPRHGDNVPLHPPVRPPTNQVEVVQRITIKSLGKFKAGYDDADREILLFTDTKTGVEFIAVTDCSLIRVLKKKEEAKKEAVDVATDLLGTVPESLVEE